MTTSLVILEVFFLLYVTYSFSSDASLHRQPAVATQTIITRIPNSIVFFLVSQLGGYSSKNFPIPFVVQH